MKMLNLTKDSAKAFMRAVLLKLIIYIVLIIASIVAVMKVASYVSARYACHTQWVESSLEYKYTLRGGCLLKLENGWLPAKNYRVN